MSKAFTTAKVTSVCQKIGRNAKRQKHSEYAVPLLGDSGTLACDTHRALLIHDDFGLYSVKKPNAPEYENAVKLIRNASEYVCEMIAPGIDELKAYRKETKSKTYDFGLYRPMVNVTYLIDLLTALPDARIYITGTLRDRFHKPLYLKSEHGEAILLPIMTTDKFDERSELIQKMQPVRAV